MLKIAKIKKKNPKINLRHESFSFISVQKPTPQAPTFTPWKWTVNGKMESKGRLVPIHFRSKDRPLSQLRAPHFHHESIFTSTFYLDLSMISTIVLILTFSRGLTGNKLFQKSA